MVVATRSAPQLRRVRAIHWRDVVPAAGPAAATAAAAEGWSTFRCVATVIVDFSRRRGGPSHERFARLGATMRSRRHDSGSSKASTSRVVRLQWVAMDPHPLTAGARQRVCRSPDSRSHNTLLLLPHLISPVGRRARPLKSVTCRHPRTEPPPLRCSRHSRRRVGYGRAGSPGSRDRKNSKVSADRP